MIKIVAFVEKKSCFSLFALYFSAFLDLAIFHLISSFFNKFPCKTYFVVSFESKISPIAQPEDAIETANLGFSLGWPLVCVPSGSLCCLLLCAQMLKLTLTLFKSQNIYLFVLF
jgi:hypothetical protein